MDQPTAAAIRSWAPPLFSWDTYGFPPGTPGDAALDVRATWAVGQLHAVTGRTLASITTTEDVAVAQKVLAAFVMTEAMGGGAAALQVLEQPWLKSFSAGSYAETRFSPAEMAGGSSKSPPFPVSLWWLLWALCTPEKQAEWMAWLTGKTPAAAVFVPVDFDGCGSGYGPLAFGSGIDNYF